MGRKGGVYSIHLEKGGGGDAVMLDNPPPSTIFYTFLARETHYILFDSFFHKQGQTVHKPAIDRETCKKAENQTEKDKKGQTHRTLE